MVGSERPPPATFLLTRTAARDLRRIHDRSFREWGGDIADQYLADLYEVMRQVASNPDWGRVRQSRSAPFLMFPARQHFLIYDRAPQGVVVLTVQHQVRDIESLIRDLTPAFLAEVDRLKQKT